MGAHCQSKINYLKAMDLVKKKKMQWLHYCNLELLSVRRSSL